MELLLALIAGVSVFLLIVGLSGARQASAVHARLSQFGTVQARSLEEVELQQPLFDRTVRPLVSRLAGVGQRLSSTRTVNQTELRLAMAGNPGGLRTIDFLGLKALLALFAGVGAFVLLGVVGRNLAYGLLAAVALTGIAFIAPEFWLRGRITQRQRRIELALPDTLDLLTISVRAGLGFDGALARVVEKTTGPLAEEFRRALAEIRVGKTRRDAMRDLASRTNASSLVTFVGAIIQADQLGVSISSVLQVQSEQLRIARRQRAEEVAARAPIKMLFPLVGCIFPALFIVVLGPAAILLIQNLGRAP